MGQKKESPTLLILAFLSIYIVWGTTYVAILFGLQGFPPFLMSALRFGTAGILLLLWCITKGKKLPVGKDFTIASISGIVMLVGGSGLVAWSEQYIASGSAAIVTATEPFLFVLLDRKRWSFYFAQKTIIAGLILGFGGILLFFIFAKKGNHQEIEPHLKIAGMVVLFISAVLWVIGSLHSKRKIDTTVSNTSTTSVQLIAAGIFSMVLSLVTGELTSFSFSKVALNAWAGLLYLILFGSIVAYLAFTWLLTVRPPALVSTHTYVNPLVALLVGWWLAGEPITLLQTGAVVIVLLGVLLATKKGPTKK